MPAAAGLPEVGRLVEVMHRLRSECPWDAKQTHLSLVRYLVEETGEVVEAIEVGSDDDLLEELGDLLLQVVFHSEIAAAEDRFTFDQVAAGIADKLVRRHPHVFGEEDPPEDVNQAWERRKADEKGRRSALEGIPQQLSALTRALKVISRASSHGLGSAVLDLESCAEDAGVGSQLLALVARAAAAGLDPEQELRVALRSLEERVLALESSRPDQED